MRLATAAPTRFVTFYNWTDREFTWMWGGVPFSIKAGEKMKMEDGMARIFAIHLGEREAERMKIVPVRVTDPFIAMANRALPDGGTVAPDVINAAGKTKEQLLNEISSGNYQGDHVTSNPVGTFDPEVDDQKQMVTAADVSPEKLGEELVKENARKLRRVKVSKENAEFAGLTQTHEVADQGAS